MSELYKRNNDDIVADVEEYEDEGVGDNDDDDCCAAADNRKQYVGVPGKDLRGVKGRKTNKLQHPQKPRNTHKKRQWLITNEAQQTQDIDSVS